MTTAEVAEMLNIAVGDAVCVAPAQTRAAGLPGGSAHPLPPINRRVLAGKPGGPARLTGKVAGSFEAVLAPSSAQDATARAQGAAIPYDSAWRNRRRTRRLIAAEQRW